MFLKITIRNLLKPNYQDKIRLNERTAHNMKELLIEQGVDSYALAISIPHGTMHVLSYMHVLRHYMYITKALEA